MQLLKRNMWIGYKHKSYMIKSHNWEIYRAYTIILILLYTITQKGRKLIQMVEEMHFTL